MKPITSGQKEQVTNFIKDAARKGAEEATAELEANGALNGDNVQRVIESKQLTARIHDFVKGQLAELAELISGFVKLISGAKTLTLVKIYFGKSEGFLYTVTACMNVRRSRLPCHGLRTSFSRVSASA